MQHDVHPGVDGVSVAEWSKALVLGTSHFDDVGSNATTAIRAGNFEA